MAWSINLSPFIIWALSFYFIILMIYFLGEYLIKDSLGLTLSHRVYLKGVTINTDRPMILISCSAYGTYDNAAIRINQRRTAK